MVYPFRLIYVLSLVYGLLLSACQPEASTVRLPDAELSDQQLAQRYCSSCHQFPEPSLLDRDTWLRSVLPAMSWRLGIRDTSHHPRLGRNMNEQHLIRQANIFPDSALLSEASWQRVVDYYDSLAPAELPTLITDTARRTAPFVPRPVTLRANTDGLFTLLRQHPVTKKIYVADGLRTLYRLDEFGSIEQSFVLPSVASDIHFGQDGSLYLLVMGDLNPHDEPLGSLLSINSRGESTVLIQQLNRPVHLRVHDLDQDGREDMIICEFGNYIGRLSWFRQTEDGTFEKHVLWEQPGAIKTVVRDLDQDGLPDVVALMAQGNEGVYAFYNQGNGRFDRKPLLQFSSVFGSSDFVLADVDQDGDEDLLLVNGDNADFSPVLKPYHGLRVYRNEGSYAFTEAYFYPMYGATRLLSADFDQDGDPDVAALAYFPDFQADHPRALVYLENTSTDSLSFVSYPSDSLNQSRWLVMELIRPTDQGAPGIMLGAFNMSLGRGLEEDVARWQEEKINLMLLRMRQGSS